LIKNDRRQIPFCLAVSTLDGKSLILWVQMALTAVAAVEEALARGGGDALQILMAEL
jgi:hypothetical protein